MGYAPADSPEWVGRTAGLPVTCSFPGATLTQLRATIP
jgi:hypothetical protein